MSSSGDTLYLTNGGWVNLSGYLDNTDNQSLSISGNSLSITSGNTVVIADDVNDADSDSTNELQILTFSNDTLYLSNGNYAVLPYDSSDWKWNGDLLYFINGNVGIGTDVPVSNLDIHGGDSTGLTIRAVSNTFSFLEIKELSEDLDLGLKGRGVRLVVDGATNNYFSIQVTDEPPTLPYIDAIIIPYFPTSRAGYIGIGGISPMSRLHVSNGDIYIDNIGSGVIMKSPDGTCWRVTVDNTGAMVTTAITCP